jgi:D-3-phosphoglycerate dehydrogenase
MSFNVIHAFPLPGVDTGEDLLTGLDVTFSKEMCVTEEDLIAHAQGADAIVAITSFHPFTKRVFANLDRCRIVAGIGVGFDTTDLEAASEAGIVVTNVPDYCIDEVSSHALALMLALNRKLFQTDRAVRQKRVSLNQDKKSLMEVAYPIFRMRDQTLGIVGLGRIGTAMALKARGLGMRVIAYDPYVLGAVMESRGVKPVDLNTLLRESDFISVHTPMNGETAGMIGYAEFTQMKPTCYFINTARGACVEQGGLIRALNEGIIAGAGLDVTLDEPLVEENALLTMPNVILTGHSAYYSITSEKEGNRKPMTQVVEVLKGEFPLYAVNPEVKALWFQKWGGTPDRKK